MGGYPGKVHTRFEGKSIILPKEARINIKDQYDVQTVEAKDFVLRISDFS